MRFLLFQDVTQNWLVVKLPMFWDILSVPSLRVRCDCLTCKDFVYTAAEASSCAYCVFMPVSPGFLELRMTVIKFRL
jgi:hypothetical protein